MELINKNPFFFYIKMFRKEFLTGLFFLLITNALDAYYPFILKDAIDQISSGQPGENLFYTALQFFALMSTLAATRFLWRTIFGKYHTYSAEDLRDKIFSHLKTLGPRFFAKNPIGELMSLITNDVQAVRQALGGGLLTLVDGVSIIILVLPMMIYLNADWTWKTLIFLPAVPFLISKVMKLIYSSFKIQQDRLSDVAAFSQELISGIRVVKGFAQEDNRLIKYNIESRKLEDASNKVSKIDALFMPIMEFGVASGSVILLLLISKTPELEAISIGSIVAFQRFIHKMVWPMSALGFSMSQIQKGMASFSRIEKFLKEVTDIPNDGKLQLEEIKTITVENLSFKYPDTDVYALKNINFEIKQGETVGIVGPVGSGKTTLINLIARLHPKTEGEIYYNSLPSHDFDQLSFYNKVSLVPQEAFLFSDTIEENISFGLPQVLKQEYLNSLTNTVDIYHEVNDLEHQFKSQLGERGVNLSGGQKQRLTIARSLAMNSDLIILDDSLSAVDLKTENKIKSELSKIGYRTKIIVTHRLSSILKADKIIVVCAGQIEAIGNHESLLQNSSTYKKMAEIQGYLPQELA